MDSFIHKYSNTIRRWNRLAEYNLLPQVNARLIPPPSRIIVFICSIKFAGIKVFRNLLCKFVSGKYPLARICNSKTYNDMKFNYLMGEGSVCSTFVTVILAIYLISCIIYIGFCWNIIWQKEDIEQLPYKNIKCYVLLQRWIIYLHHKIRKKDSDEDSY